MLTKGLSSHTTNLTTPGRKIESSAQSSEIIPSAQSEVPTPEAALMAVATLVAALRCNDDPKPQDGKDGGCSAKSDLTSTPPIPAIINGQSSSEGDDNNDDDDDDDDDDVAEPMKSGEEDYPTAHPGWPFCREWSQTKNSIQFTISFPTCVVSSESVTVSIENNYCWVRCQSPDESECHWGTRLWKPVDQIPTNVIVQDGNIRVECRKEEIGLRWEKLGTARARRF